MGQGPLCKMYRACAIRLYLASRTGLLLEKDRLTFAQLANIIDDKKYYANKVIASSKKLTNQLNVNY